jgi:hypothetical protein
VDFKLPQARVQVEGKPFHTGICPLQVRQVRVSPHTERKGHGIGMADCMICTEKELLLRQAVLEHWQTVRQFRAALEGSEDLSRLDVTMYATQVMMNRAEDSYRQHLRVMHEPGRRTPAISTFTRFYTRSQSEVVGN